MTPSEPAPAGTSRDRRLHPWSWLFVLLQQMKQYVIPLVRRVLLRGDRNELWPLIGVGVLALISVMQYFTYRYSVRRDVMTIRSGWLHRQRREIPYRAHPQRSRSNNRCCIASSAWRKCGWNPPAAQARSDDARADAGRCAGARTPRAPSRRVERATSESTGHRRARAGSVARAAAGEVLRLGLVPIAGSLRWPPPTVRRSSSARA
jgi:putative membrane protein